LSKEEAWIAVFDISVSVFDIWDYHGGEMWRRVFW